MVLALCTSSDDFLSMYQVLFNSLLCFQRHAPDKLDIAKIMKGSNSVNTGDRLRSLHYAISLMTLCTKFHFITFSTVRDMHRKSLSLQKLEREITPLEWYRIIVLGIKFHLIPFYIFRDMLRTTFILQKFKREG